MRMMRHAHVIPRHLVHCPGVHRPGVRYPRGSSAGFTLIEIMVVVAIASLLAYMAMLAFTTYVPRFQLRGTANQIAQMINRARLEAIKRRVTTVVAADFNDRTMTLFADVNGDPADPSAAGALYLVLDPDLLEPPDRTDYLIATFPLPGQVDRGIQFAGPVGGIAGADAVDGFTPVPAAPADPPVMAFSPTGAILDVGAFRLSDASQSNFLETAVINITGKVEVRKYLLDVDSPTGTAGFFAEGSASFDVGQVGRGNWVWYD